MGIRTLRDSIADHFRDEALYIEPPEGGRTWAHDAIHALLGLEGTAKTEYIVGIYQAVLMRSTKVSPTHEPLEDGEEEVSWQDIVEKIIPGVQEHNERVARNAGFRIRTKITEDEAREAYEHARAVGRLIMRKFGGPLGSFDFDRIVNIPAADLECLFEAAQHVKLASDLKQRQEEPVCSLG